MARTISDLLDAKRRDGAMDGDGAIACSVDQSTYTRWRLGQSIPRDANWPALARWLKVSEKRIGDAVNEQRRQKRRAKLQVVSHLPAKRRRTAPQVDQALVDLEAEVKRQTKDLTEMKKSTAELTKLVTELLAKYRN